MADDDAQTEADPGPEDPGAEREPRVVLRRPFYVKELGAVRAVSVHPGAVTLHFAEGSKLEVHGADDDVAALAVALERFKRP
jgi:hypothetical protein